MSARRLLGLIAVSCLAVACGPPGDGAVPCGELEPRNDSEVALCNGLDQAVIASVAWPEGEPPVGGWPGVVLLHGSGGLFYSGDGYPCTETIQAQFQIWVDLLNERGIAVVLPASFYSRGFCDWDERLTVPRKLDDHERLIVRTFDAAAAAQFLCDDPRVDCSRLAVMGFSNGASTTLMLLQDDISITQDPRLHELERPSLVGGVAYYPGCGLNDELSNELSEAEIDRFYYPSAPLWVPAASKDNLAKDCEELRDPQVDAVAERRGVTDDMFELEVYAGAKHGFDGEPDDSKANRAAHDDAQQETLARLEAWLLPP
jgi:dienelactone hydrolase